MGNRWVVLSVLEQGGGGIDMFAPNVITKLRRDEEVSMAVMEKSVLFFMSILEM